MKQLFAVLAATLFVGSAYADRDCASEYFDHGRDQRCTSYTGECPTQYALIVNTCSGYGDDADDGYQDGEGEGYGRIMSTADSLQPLFGHRDNGCYQTCEYLYGGGPRAE